MQTTGGHGLGWRRDLPDQRDHKFAAPQDVLKALPRTVDHRPNLPPVLAQLALGSCTANSAATIYDHLRFVQGRSFMYPSRLFQYFNTRFLEGTVESDSGASIRETIKAMVTYGMCPEAIWPYVPGQYRTRPPNVCYEVGERGQVVEYLRVGQSAAEIMGALASGYCFEFGMQIYQQFEDVGSSGVIQMPAFHARPLGGHSGAAVGYFHDSAGNAWVIDRNSWGPEHGDHGDVYLPMAYVTDQNLTGDLWMIRLIEPDEAPPLPPPPTPIPPPLPEPESWIGERIKSAMAKYGDRYAGGEVYLAGASGKGEYAVLWAESGRPYTYIFHINRVARGQLPEELF